MPRGAVAAPGAPLPRSQRTVLTLACPCSHPSVPARSATTYSVCQSFWHVAHALNKTFVVSLLQPAPEVVHLFDDVLLLTDGHVVYQ